MFATAQLIRTARRGSALTLRQLAERAHTSHSAIAAYESSSKTPNLETLLRIVEAAGFAVDIELRARQRGTSELGRGQELVAVLELAAQFPARHTETLEAPVFRRLP